MKLPMTLWTSLLLCGCYTGLDGVDGQTGSAGGDASDAGEDGAEGGDSGDDSGDEQPLDCSAGPHVGAGDLVSLSRIQYDNTVRDLLGLDGYFARNSFPNDRVIGMFEVGAIIDPGMARSLVLVAESVAQDVQVASVVPCDMAAADDSCADEFIEQFGRRVFRHDLSSEETLALREIYDMADDFDAGIRLVIQAALQSPQFIFLYIPDTADAVPGEVIALDDFSIASRLSYMLWNTTPDDTLLAAASAGELATPEGLDAQMQRMLADPRAEQGVMEFYSHVLNANKIASVTKNPEFYPEFTPELAYDLERSLQRGLLDLHFGEEDGSLGDLMTALPLYASDRMASYYGWSREEGEGFTPVTDPGNHGGGVMMHPAMATLLGKPREPAIVGRGIFVLEHLQCTTPPPPPAGAEDMQGDPEPGATPREHFEQHRADSSCSGCHKLIDPVGFSMEHYDSDGRWRTHYPAGQPIDASDVYTPLGSGDEYPFESLVDLEPILAEHELTRDCMVDHWIQFAARRTAVANDLCTQQALRERFEQSGGDLNDLIAATIQSDAFRYIAVPE